VSSTFDEGPKATAERVLKPTELQRQDVSQRSPGAELVNEPTKNNPLAKEEATDYGLAFGPSKGRDQIAYKHSTEKDQTSDEAVLPKVEHKPHAVEEEALRPTFRTVFRKAVASRASRKASGSLGTDNSGHINQPAITSSAEGNEGTSIEVKWMPNLDPKEAESAPMSSASIGDEVQYAYSTQTRAILQVLGLCQESTASQTKSRVTRSNFPTIHRRICGAFG